MSSHDMMPGRYGATIECKGGTTVQKIITFVLGGGYTNIHPKTLDALETGGLLSFLYEVGKKYDERVHFIVQSLMKEELLMVRGWLHENDRYQRAGLTFNRIHFMPSPEKAVTKTIELGITHAIDHGFTKSLKEIPFVYELLLGRHGADCELSQGSHRICYKQHEFWSCNTFDQLTQFLL